MAVLALFSAKGSPGVSTTAMLCAALWPRPALLVDCDPAGGDVGLRLSDPTGRPLNPERGLLSLLPLARRGIEPHMLLEHSQTVTGGGQVVLGLPGPEQALAVGPLWNTLAEAFGQLAGYDVILDLGRIDSRSPMLGLLRSAQVGICVLTPSLPGVVSARNRLRLLIPEIVGVSGSSGPRVGLAVRAGKAHRDVSEAVAAVQASDRLIRFFGTIADDPAGAGIFEGQPVSRPERSLLVRSGRGVISNVLAELAQITQPPSQPPAQPSSQPLRSQSPVSQLRPATDAPFAPPADLGVSNRRQW